VTPLAILFLVVSVSSLGVQGVALWRVAHAFADTRMKIRVHDGMVRTAVCRTVAALLYVTTGIAALTAHPFLPVVALAVLLSVQVMWQINAIADVRLRRDLERHE
jgi:hypothetical protein